MKVKFKILSLVIILLFLFGIIFILYYQEGDDLPSEVYYDYEYIGTSTKKPESLHLCIEASNGDLYFVDSVDNTKLYKIENGSNTASEVLDKDDPIVAMWYDRTNELLYYIIYDSVTGDAEQRTYNLSNQNDTQIRFFSTSTIDNTGNLDTFIDGNGDYWFRVIVDLAGNRRIYMFNTGIGDQFKNMGAMAGRTSNQSPIVVIGGYAWFLWKWSNENVELWKWEIATANWTEMEDLGANTDIPSSLSQRVLVYDGSDKISFVLYDTSDSKYYLWTYIISTDTAAKGPEFNVSLMLDRNNVPASGTPNEYEKAYGTSSKIAYQLTRSYNHLVKIYDFSITPSHIATGNIRAITDNYVITEDYEIYKVADLTPKLSKCIAKYKINSFAEANIESRKLIFAKNQFFKMYDPNDVLFFEGIILKRLGTSQGRQYYLECLAQSHLQRKVTGDYSGSATEIATIAQALINQDDYLYADGTSIPNLSITYAPNFLKHKLKLCLDELGERGDALWYHTPNGYVWLLAASNLTSSGITKSQSTKGINPPKIMRIDVEVNYVEIYGRTSSGALLEGIAQDEEKQKLYGKIEWLGPRYYGTIEDQTQLDNLAAAILAGDQASNYPMQIGLILDNSNYVQVGETMNLQWTFLTELAAAADYPIIEVTYDAKANKSSLVLSNGILQGGGYGTPIETKLYNLERDLLALKNLIEQNASIISTIIPLGSANKAYISCRYIARADGGAIKEANGYISNVDGTDCWLLFELPLPTDYGTYKLYVDGLEVILKDADADAYVQKYYVKRSGTLIDNDDAWNKNTIDTHEATFTAVDCSSDNKVTVELYVVVDAAGELDIGKVSLRCYYV